MTYRQLDNFVVKIFVFGLLGWLSAASFQSCSRVVISKDSPPPGVCGEASWVSQLQDAALSEKDLNELTTPPPGKRFQCVEPAERFFRLKNSDTDLVSLTEPIEKNSQQPEPPRPPQAPPSAKESNSACCLGWPKESIQEKAPPPVPVKQELSRVETLYNELDGMTKGKSLAQFGYEIFKNPTPNSVIGPVDPNYILGPEDEILIRAVGGVEIDQPFTVDRDGAIFIPKVGAVMVGYQTFNSAKILIEKKIAEQFHNFTLDISLGKLHSIPILVTGNVLSPGIHVIPANANLIDLLSAAGGITKNGSLRKIIQKRAYRPDIVIDLYDLLLKGSQNHEWSLLPGDTLHIPPIGETAAIVGPINSGIYELNGDATIKTFLNYAGGENGFTLLETILLERTSDNKNRKLLSIDYSKEGTEIIKDSDVIQFFTISSDINNSVFLTGAVVRPGSYAYKENMKVSELLKYGEGFLLGASLEYAILERQIGKISCYDQTLGDASNCVQQQVRIINLASLLCGDLSEDIPLKKFDKIKILTIQEAQEDPQVNLIGAVRKPGAYKITSEMTLGDLIKIAGGPTPEAYQGQSMIVRRAVSFDQRQYDVDIIPFDLIDVLQGGKAAKIMVKNLDQIVIKKIQTLNVKAEISGAVRFPGVYVLPKGAQITDLLQVAGGFQEMADLRGAIFLRPGVKELQMNGLNYLFAITWERFNHARDELTKNGDIREGVAGQLSLLGLKSLEASMRTFQVNGRIVLNLLNPNFPNSFDNLRLTDGDILMIPEKNHIVAVSGEVFSPNAYVWNKNHTVLNYLSKAGWFHQYANRNQTFVLKATGEVVSAAQIGLNRLLNTRVGPGDIILVPPQELERSPHLVVRDLLLDVLQVLRGYSEYKLIDATIPQAGNRNALINIDTSKPEPVYIPAGSSYDTVIQQQSNLFAPKQ